MNKKNSLMMFFVITACGSALPVFGASMERVGSLPPVGGVTIRYIDSMLLPAGNSYEILIGSQNEGSDCGYGTPASIWKMTLDPTSGEANGVAYVQSLDLIQTTRGVMFESANGTLFTASGWCGFKPPYYSTDRGQSWLAAINGAVYPPNSVFSYAEFNGHVYAGTGYQPYPGEIYRWEGDGSWTRVFNNGYVRHLISSMAVHEGRLFVGTVDWDYPPACDATVPVLVTSDGVSFHNTTGIPGCFSIGKLVEVNGQLLAFVSDSYQEKRIYRWNAEANSWIFQAPNPVTTVNPLMVLAHDGNLYSYGSTGSNPAGIFRSTDSGTSWTQIAAQDATVPVVMSFTSRNDTLYMGTYADSTGSAYVYRYHIERQQNPCTRWGRRSWLCKLWLHYHHRH